MHVTNAHLGSFSELVAELRKHGPTIAHRVALSRETATAAWICAVVIGFTDTILWWWLPLAFIACWLPDGDYLFYAPNRSRMHPPSHRLCGGHYPILTFAAIYQILWQFGASTEAWFIVCFGVFTHYVLDSLEPHGLHWFAPISWTSVSLHGWRMQLVSRETLYETLLQKAQARSQTGSGEILSRMPDVRACDRWYFGLSLVALTTSLIAWGAR